MKPTDKAILGMVSELSGRNGMNPEVASLQFFRRPNPLVRDEGCMACRRLADAAGHFGGVVGPARWQGHAEQLVKPSSSPSRNRGSKVERITGKTGKAIE